MALNQLSEYDDFDEILSILQDANDDTLSVFKIVEQAPIDQQTLDEKLLNAVTATGASTSVTTIDKKELTVCIVATVDSTGGTIVCQGSPDNSNWGTVAATDTTGTLNESIDITTSGTYFYEIVNASTLKYFRVNITSTDGASVYTVYLTGRA